MAVTEDNTDLRGGGTLLRELADVVNDLLGGGLQPRRRGARVGDGGRGNALSLAVKTTHFDVLVVKKKVPEGECRRVVARSKKSKFIFWRNFFLWNFRAVECGSREWNVSLKEVLFLPRKKLLPPFSLQREFHEEGSIDSEGFNVELLMMMRLFLCAGR